MEISSSFLTNDEMALLFGTTEPNNHGGIAHPITLIEFKKTYEAATTEKEKREAALEWINSMSPLEFEMRLKNDTLPNFIRIRDERPLLVRYSNAPSRFLTEEELQLGVRNQGFINRSQLMYLSIERFLKEYYDKPS
jgi:hypothetical protein